MLGIFGLLFGGAIILKDTFADMTRDQKYRTDAYNEGRFFWIDSKGKYRLVEDNTRVYIGHRNGDRCVFRLRDGAFLKNLSAEFRAQEEKEKKKREDEYKIKHNAEVKKNNEESRKKAIEEGNALYIYHLTDEQLEKYNVDRLTVLWKDVDSGELFSLVKSFSKGSGKYDYYFSPIVANDYVSKDGRIYLNETYIGEENSCYTSVRKNNNYVYVRTNNKIKGAIIDC